MNIIDKSATFRIVATLNLLLDEYLWSCELWFVAACIASKHGDSLLQRVKRSTHKKNR